MGDLCTGVGLRACSLSLVWKMLFPAGVASRGPGW